MKNRDAIASWGKTQISKFKAWAKEKKDELIGLGWIHGNGY